MHPSACEPYRELIRTALEQGRNATAIYQDLVEDHGFTARYASVKRFVAKLRGPVAPDARVVIRAVPGEEGQVDYGGDGPPLPAAATTSTCGAARIASRIAVDCGPPKDAFRIRAPIDAA